MKKILKLMCTLFALFAVFWVSDLLSDKQHLQDSIIRLHVVANSDDEEDQKQKLQIRDAIIAYLKQEMHEISDKEQAKHFLEDHISELEDIANETLRSAGSTYQAQVSLALEEFDMRVYDTFTLPAGVYDSLRIKIGDASGKNWWCVVFPSLCLSATTDGFYDTAVSSGFSESLTNTLSGQPGYEVRFFFLDCLGKLQNLLFG